MQCSQHLPLGLWQQETAGYRFSLMINTQIGEIQVRSYADLLPACVAGPHTRLLGAATLRCSLAPHAYGFTGGYFACP